MMKKSLIILAVCAFTMLAVTGVSFAGDVRNYDVKASIQSTTQLTVSIAKVIGTSYTFGQAAVDFGQLVLAAGIFQPADGGFYAVDVGITSNDPNWVVNHGITPVALIGNPGINLDNNINVTFTRQPDPVSNPSGTPVDLHKVAYANSNSIQVGPGDIPTGFYLRIYYGIASGAGNAPGVVGIPSTQATGNYAGQVTLTLTP